MNTLSTIHRLTSVTRPAADEDVPEAWSLGTRRSELTRTAEVTMLLPARISSSAVCLMLFLFATSAWAEDSPLAFSTDIQPLLQKNCLACHNESEYEGELILESLEQILKGGDSGPAVIPGNANESLLYQVATHGEEPVMPPPDNDVGAEKLTDEQLGMLKSWIDQGAKDEGVAATAKIQWQPIADELASVLALDVSPDGYWLAVGRGNQLRVYSIPQQKLMATLVDESIAGTHPDAAHLDSVQSVAWSPDQRLLVSGGYRVVKVWQREELAATDGERQQEVTLEDAQRQVSISPERGVAHLWQTGDEKQLATLAPDIVKQYALARADFRHGIRTQRLAVLKTDIEASEKRKSDAENDVKKADEEIATAQEELKKKRDAQQESLATLKKLQAELEQLNAQASQQAESAKSLNAQLEAANRDRKTELEKEIKEAEAAKQNAEQAIASKKKARDNAQKEADKKQQELMDAEQAVERSRAARSRLQEIVSLRQSEIEEAGAVHEAYREEVDGSSQALENLKQSQPSPWVHVAVSTDASSFQLHTADQVVATFAVTDGTLLGVGSPLGGWKLIETIGDPNGASPFADRVTALDFRHDGKILATGGGEPSRSGEVQLWDTQSWQQLAVVEDIHSDVVYDIQFAPLDDDLITCASDRMVKLIDGESFRHVRTFEGHTGHVLGVSWRANGRLLATAGADQVVKVWDAKEGGQKKTISGFKDEITAVRYLGLEDRLVFGSGDGSVHSRDSEGKGKPGFGKLTDYIHRISTSRDGKTIAAAGTDRTVRVWNAEQKLLVEIK